MPLSIVDIMNFTNYFSVLSQNKKTANHYLRFFYLEEYQISLLLAI